MCAEICNDAGAGLCDGTHQLALVSYCSSELLHARFS